MLEHLYANATAVTTSLGGGTLGHLEIIMRQTLYNRVSHPTSNITIAARQSIMDDHKKKRVIYEKNINMDIALTELIINTVHPMYLKAERSQYMGFHGVSTLELMQNLLDRYGKKSPANIEANRKRMMEPYDSSQPINVFFETIEDCVQYAEDGKIPISHEQVMQTAYNSVHASGLYNDACKEWRHRVTTLQTWYHFKTFFATEYHDQKEQQRTTSGQSQYFANAATDNGSINIVETLDNLALSATNDRDVLTALIESNKTLTKNNEKLVAKMEEIATSVTKLTNNANNNNNWHNNKLL